MSSLIREDIIATLGSLHHGRKKIQPAGREIRAFYTEAAEHLQHPLLTFNPAAIQAIADAFEIVVKREKYTCYACAIMPDHIHIIIRKHKDVAEDMIEKLQYESMAQLRRLGLRAMDHPVWGGPGWKVFLDHPDEVVRTIKYVEDNPIKIGRPMQRWPFVNEYDRWPLHPGHSPNSPYVKLLKAAGRYPSDR